MSFEKPHGKFNGGFLAIGFWKCSRIHLSWQLMKFVERRLSFSGKPYFSFPRAMLLIRNDMFLASVLAVCFPSSSFSASPGILP